MNLSRYLTQLDWIILDKMHLTCIIGVHPHERTAKQELVISVEIGLDLHPAGIADDLEFTIDYDRLEQNIIGCVERSSFQLLEALAEAIVSVCAEEKRTQAVAVTIKKPGVLNRADGATIRIFRHLI